MLCWTGIHTKTLTQFRKTTSLVFEKSHTAFVTLVCVHFQITPSSYLWVVQESLMRISRPNFLPFGHPCLPPKHQNTPPASDACRVSRPRWNLARRVPVSSGRDVSDRSLHRRPGKRSATYLENLVERRFHE